MHHALETLTVDIEAGIALIRLNRPDQLNAITNQSVVDLVQAFDITDADDAVKVVIVTGNGRAFCAGADLSSGADALTFDPATDPNVLEVNGVVRDGGGRVVMRIFNSHKPVIGAINGVAVGAGATIPLAMDIRLAVDSARFGYPFSRRGIVPESASSWFLPRIVGISKALEWCFSGRIFSAAEALEAGLVRSLHSADELLPKAYELAREIVENTAPVSVALTRQMLWRMLTADHPMQAHRVDSLAVQLRGRTADVEEGISSFLEKRPPQYPGKVSTDLPDIFPGWQEPEF